MAPEQAGGPHRGAPVRLEAPGIEAEEHDDPCGFGELAGSQVAEDHAADSPSTAAGVLLGRSSNGRELRKDADGRTLKANQTAAVGAITAAG